MKKGLAFIAFAAIVIAVYFLFFNKEESKQEEPKQQALAQSKNTDEFNKPFNQFLNSYYTLKNDFVNWDSMQINKDAQNLMDAAATVPYKALKADSSIVTTAQSLSESVVAEAKGMLGEPALEGKRRSFYTLSENLYNLIRAVHYDQQVIYHMKCPMAFNDSEDGYWVSNSSEIVNPYLGNKHPKYHAGMIGCGSVTDSIDYRAK